MASKGLIGQLTTTTWSRAGPMVFASILYAKLLAIPLVVSYHTHIPEYIPRCVYRPLLTASTQTYFLPAIPYCPRNDSFLTRSILSFLIATQTGSIVLMLRHTCRYTWKGLVGPMWGLIRFAARMADLTLVTSKVMKVRSPC